MDDSYRCYFYRMLSINVCLSECIYHFCQKKMKVYFACIITLINVITYKWIKVSCHTVVSVNDHCKPFAAMWKKTPEILPVHNVLNILDCLKSNIIPKENLKNTTNRKKLEQNDSMLCHIELNFSLA